VLCKRTRIHLLSIAVDLANAAVEELKSAKKKDDVNEHIIFLKLKFKKLKLKKKNYTVNPNRNFKLVGTSISVWMLSL